MRATKQEILESLSALMEKYPEMRIGQLVINVSHWALGPATKAPWKVTNEEWLAAAKENLRECSRTSRIN